MKCKVCQKRLTCGHCRARAAGRAGSPEAKARAGRASVRARWRWTVGDLVTARLKKYRSWQGVVEAVKTGRRGRRLVSIRISSPMGGTFSREVPESLLARAPKA